MPPKVPLLSIIMPVKNLEDYIEDCLSSIVNQSFEDWELIIINDHSTDKTLSIINQFASNDNRISCFTNQGQGIIPALQLALSKSKGTFISRFDGDDIMPDGRLLLMIDALSKSPGKTIVTGKAEYFSVSPISKGYREYQEWLNQRIDFQDHWKWIYRECPVASPNWIANKFDIQEIGGFDRLSYPEDYHLTLKWYQNGFNIHSLNQTTLMWREHTDRTSRNSEHYNQESFFRLKLDHFIKNELNQSQLIVWGTGVKGRLTKRILDQLGTAFLWMDFLPKGTSKELSGQSVTNFKSIEKLKIYKLLLAIYPSKKERKEMEDYLNQQGLKLGRDYWYL